MTLILGARCTDGVVISGDRKIVDLATRDLIRYSTKLFGALRNVIFGYAGSEDMFRVFLRYIVGDLVILRDDPDRYTNNNLFQKLSNTMHILRKIRNRQDFALEIMVARQFPNDGQSDLYFLNSFGNYDRITEWRVIGQGEVIARPLVQNNWNTDMEMKEFAELSYCIIKYIEEKKLNDSVGTGHDEPSIKYLEDTGDLDTEPFDNELKGFKQACSRYAKRFGDILAA
jgi:20S proteasome alpha/beta subunit